MITPDILQIGDTVAIVSTAGKVSLKEIQTSIVLLKQWRLKVKLGVTIDAEDNQFAGNDALRVKDFQQMMDDPKVKAIWCARGGYGTVRIIDQLDFSSFIKTPKWIIGYSDVTVLHSHIHNLGVETLHAQMPFEIEDKTDASINSLKQALFGESYYITYSSKINIQRKGTVNGQLIGGNLSILYSLCGSTSGINTRGKILFIEDLDEYLYHLDRMLQNLKRNKIFENLSGLIVGGMTKMQDNSIPYGRSAEEIIRDIVTEYDFPICFNFPAGHVEDNRALIFGRNVQLNISDRKVQLRF